MVDTAVVAANGAVGMTGYTRAIVTVQTAGASQVFTLPNTFILKGYIPNVMVDGEAGAQTAVAISALTVTGAGVATATFATSVPAGTEIVLFGILGRRDFGPRTVENYMSENPNTAGRP